MNDALILKMIRPLITEDKVNDFVNYITDKVITEYPGLMAGRDPEQSIIGLAFIEDAEIRVAIAVMNPDFKITEVIRSETLAQAANRLLKNL